MRIWRIEDRSGLGPYSGCNLDEIDMTDSDMHPLLENDGVDREEVKRVEVQGYSFGFSSLTQLDAWMKLSVVDAWTLQTHGYLIVEYEVPKEKIIFGQHQVAFDKTVALVVEARELTI